MDLFKSLAKTGSAEESASKEPSGPLASGQPQPTVNSLRSKSRRDAVYSVRVRDDFKSKMHRLQAELQIERQDLLGKCRKVTEGEVVELMLEAFKAKRGQSTGSALAVPLSKDVWEGIHSIARFRRIAPAQVVEELVVRQINDLGLMPQKRG